jgi:hypothetical protein
MTNKELIKSILELTDDYSAKELKKLKKVDLEEIYSTTFLPDEFDEDSWDEEEEDVVIDISKLSKYEQRHYAKTGQLPQTTINRYTRFDEEEVDEGE